MEFLERRTLLDAGGLAPVPDRLESVIVTLKDDVANPSFVAQEVADFYKTSVGHVYEHALKGFSVSLPSAAIVAISRHPLVERVEPNLAECRCAR